MLIKKILKILAIAILVLFVIAQFIPKHNGNNGTIAGPNFIGNKYQIPANIDRLFKTGCYDCHSNHTYYPWYASMQPVSMWLNDHIEEGKRKLNFTQYLAGTAWRQFHAMEDIQEQMEKNEMPLESYTLIHRDAKLSPAERNEIIAWSKTVRENLKNEYPADSLKRPARK